MKKEINWLLREKYNGKPSKAFEKDVKRLKNGEPVDYVIGFTEFLGCKIDLSKKTLIPRPETEFWAGVEIEKLKNLLKIENCKLKIRCLDMFAGSGCIGIAILKHIKNVIVVFADKDKKCLEQIKINLEINGVKNNFIVRQSDVFSGFTRQKLKHLSGRGFDLVFANPPYIPIKNKYQIQESVLKYEPNGALFGGGDGLFYINKFLRDARLHLNPNGKIFMEFDGSAAQKREIEKLLKNYKYRSWKFHKDQFGKPRWIMLFF